MPKISAKFDRGHPLRGRRMQVGWVKIGDFWLITGYISKTVKDRHIVSIKVEWEVVCALSNDDIAVDLECPLTTPFSAFCTAIHSFVTGEPRDFVFGTLTDHSKSHPAEEKSSLKGAWSGSREQFLHCGLRKFRHSKSSVYRWYTQFDRRRFVYDTWENGSRLIASWLSAHCLSRIAWLNLQLHTIDWVRTCRISSFCTVAWQLAWFQLTRRIARSHGDSWASCLNTDISPGSVATCFRCADIFTHNFVANLLLSLTVEEFWKSVNIWRSYVQEYSVLFLLTHSVVWDLEPSQVELSVTTKRLRVKQ